MTAPSLAAKGVGYGMPGKRVDGNDVAALLAVMGEAADRARRGDGPTLIEALNASAGKEAKLFQKHRIDISTFGM